MLVIYFDLLLQIALPWPFTTDYMSTSRVMSHTHG